MNNPSFCSLEYFSILRNKMSKSHYFEMYKVFIIIFIYQFTKQVVRGDRYNGWGGDLNNIQLTIFYFILQYKKSFKTQEPHPGTVCTPNPGSAHPKLWFQNLGLAILQDQGYHHRVGVRVQ